MVIPSSPAQYSSVIVDDGPAGSSDASTAKKSRDAEFSAVSTQQPVVDHVEVGQVDAADGHYYAPSAIITGKEDSGGAMV